LSTPIIPWTKTQHEVWSRRLCDRVNVKKTRKRPFKKKKGYRCWVLCSPTSRRQSVFQPIPTASTDLGHPWQRIRATNTYRPKRCKNAYERLQTKRQRNGKHKSKRISTPPRNGQTKVRFTTTIYCSGRV